jgi:hypothetical protein
VLLHNMMVYLLIPDTKSLLIPDSLLIYGLLLYHNMLCMTSCQYFLHVHMTRDCT